MSSIKNIRWTTKRINKFWDAVGSTRLEELSFNKLAGENFLKSIGPFLSKGNEILDFGSGSGELIELLCNKGFYVAGFESSEIRRKKILEKMKDKNGFIGLIDEKSGHKFDVVIMTEIIEHLLDKDLKRVLECVSKFLKKDGIIVITTPNKEDLELNSVYCVISNCLFHRWQHVRSYSAEEVESLFGHYGFKRLRLGFLDFSNDVTWIEEYKRFNRSLIYLRSIIENLFLKFGTDFSYKPSKIDKEQVFLLEKFIETIDVVDVFEQIHKVDESHITKNFSRNNRMSKESFLNKMSIIKIKLELLEQKSKPFFIKNKNYDFAIGHETTILYIGQRG